ncbi:MAG TPA: autotransporter domain-containing protein [Acetobacteraceae bacterium]|nr:autotransporter domain-containing protein [Acetobacteraceae bacterium]
MRPLALGAAILFVPGTAEAAVPDQFIGFGDSTMDSGYFRYGPTGGSPGLPSGAPSDTIDRLIQVTVAAGGSGAFLGPGVVDTIQLAGKFGLTALPSTYPGGGTNYANGSAQTVPTTADDAYSHGLYNNVPIVSQIYNYIAAVHGAANPNALYMISYGGNDLIWLQNQAPSSLAPLPYIQSLATALTTSIASLQAAGARNIIVLNVYAYAKLVGSNGSLTSADATVVNEAATYSAEVWSGLGAAGVNFIPADVEGVLRYVSQNPTSFGFTPATVLASSPACGTTVGLVCAPAQLVSPDAQQTYLWGDANHLSTAGQTIEADYIYSLMTAPSEISLLSESAVQIGRSHVATIQRQIDLSQQHRGPNGINAWVSAGAESLSLQNLPHYPNASGTPFGGSMGVDYLTSGGVIVGLAVTGGSQALGFSTGGQFTQTGETLSLYAAYSMGPMWGNAIASYGLLQNRVARQVTLGVFTDQNNGNADGHALGLALRGGYDFHVGPVTIGPVLGAVLQQVRIGGFTETGTSGFTALAFGAQTQGSVVSQLGWRGSLDLGNWHPFAEMEWDHEWVNTNRSITAALTSIAAPSWSTAAAPIASNWATASVGVAYRVTPQVTVGVAGSAVFINPQASSYGGELGLNVAF